MRKTRIVKMALNYKNLMSFVSASKNNWKWLKIQWLKDSVPVS